MSAAAVTGLYYDDFRVGAEYVTAEHALTAAEIAAFARLTGDDNPLHTDPDAARAAGFRDVIAHGFLTQSLAMGLIADLGIMRGTTIALVGAHLRFVAPALAGDRIRVAFHVSSKRAQRGSDRGVLHRRAAVLNQDDAVLVQGRLVNLMRRQP